MRGMWRKIMENVEKKNEANVGKNYANVEKKYGKCGKIMRKM